LEFQEEIGLEIFHGNCWSYLLGKWAIYITSLQKTPRGNFKENLRKKVKLPSLKKDEVALSLAP